MIREKCKLSKTTHVVVVLLFVLYALSIVCPFVWTFLMSLKGQLEYVQHPAALPEKWLFSNYIRAFTELDINGVKMFEMIGNSLWFSIGVSLINIFFCVCYSYALAKYKFPGKRVLEICSYIMVILPIVGSLPSTYKIYSALGLLNSRWYIIAGIGGCMGYNSFIYKAAFNGMDNAYMEAAFIDGAGHFKIFFQVMLPQILSPVMALFIMAFIANLNDYMGPFLFYESMPTLMSGLYIYQSRMGRASNVPVMYAGIILSLLPVLLLFFIFQDKMMNLSLGGGIKG